MDERLLLCTDLDRTALPNGAQAESPGARQMLARLAARDDVTLVYVSGRDRSLVLDALRMWSLPAPSFVIGDVGTTIWHVDAPDEWRADPSWQDAIGADWAGRSHPELAAQLEDVPELMLQPAPKQGRYKLSYYLPASAVEGRLQDAICARLERLGIRYRLVFSIDETCDQGLLDVLPARASKLHAIEALAAKLDAELSQIVFCGDSGNDLEVLTSGIPSVLVANATDDVRAAARRGASEAGNEHRLYCASGGFLGMNGCYAAGILEGIAHYRPTLGAWLESQGAVT